MDDAAAIFLVGIVVLAAVVAIPILAIASWVRVRRLERTVAALEQRLAAGPVETLAAPPTLAAAPAVAPAPPIEPPPSVQPAPSAPPTLAAARTGFDWEHLIAGRWLNRVGLAAVAIGVAYFLKLAIDNDWIGPRGQVALGLLLGVGLLAAAPALARRGFIYFADGLSGLGAAILYLSLWAAGSYYGFLSPSMTFVAMAAVTAGMLAIALGRNSKTIAVLAMVGGFITPALVNTGRDAQVALFSYLALHNTALLVIAWMRRWRFLELPAFVLTEIYFLIWFDRFYTADRLASTIAFSALFFVQFSAIPAIRSRRTGEIHPEQMALSVFNFFVFLATLHEILWPIHRFELAIATLALALVYLGLARAVAARTTSAPPARLLFAGLALTCVTLAIPISLDGHWVTLAWAVEAAVLMWSGFSAGVWQLRASAFLLFAMVALRLSAAPPDATEFLVNPRFGLILSTAACAGVALFCAQRWRSALTPLEPVLFGILAIAVNLLLLAGLTAEVDLYYSTRPETRSFAEIQLALSLTVSLLWMGYAALLLLVGVRLSSALLRWQALALFAVTSLKVFFVDLSHLSGVYRIISSIALGVVLLVISFLYQRSLAERRGAQASERA
jgi:uncharacterized membrane protein